MTDHHPLSQLGSTLRLQRERHGLTQADLADRVATSQATVARIERGDRTPNLALAERLFAALGWQLRFTLEPLGHELDQAIAALAGVAVEQRVADAGIAEFADSLAPIPYVFTGATAALLQGAPVPAAAMEIAVARRDCDAFTGWLGRRYAARWHEQYQEYGYRPLDPREPGERRWRIIGSVIVRVELCDDLPDSIEVRHGGRSFRVAPVSEVEIIDPAAARLLRRYRERSDRAG